MTEPWGPEGTYYVYIMGYIRDGRFGAPVKIGITKSLGSREKSIRTANPRSVKILHSLAVPDRSIAREIEAAFHATQKPYRLNGEWFDIPPLKALQILLLQFRMALDLNGVGEEVIPQILELSGANKGTEICQAMMAGQL